MRRRHITLGLLSGALAGTVSADGVRSGSLPNKVTDSPLLNSRFLLFGSRTLRRQTLQWILQRNNTDMVAPLIYALRYLAPGQRPAVARTLRKLTGQRLGDRWFNWVTWQQTRDDIVPFQGFDAFLAALLQNIDPAFDVFVYPGMQHRIRLEEIVWGGVAAGTGIPPLDQPNMVAANDAGYLSANERVFGLSINGDHRAYPYRIMDWHEMLNDVVGGVPVTLAYCTLCGSGILFDTRQSDRSSGASRAMTFGSSGLLYRSNKLMFDRGTHSLWNQFTGQPVTGPLTDSGLAMKVLPLVSTTWKTWRTQHPDTKVLDINTGFTRDYQPGKAYGDYFRSRDLMFPAATSAADPPAKSEVFVLRLSGAAKSWPLRRFRTEPVINDSVGTLQVVLIGDARKKTVRAYRREGITLNEALLNAQWTMKEEALYGPNGVVLTRLPGHLAYAFAWQTYFGGDKKDPAIKR